MKNLRAAVATRYPGRQAFRFTSRSGRAPLDLIQEIHQGPAQRTTLAYVGLGLIYLLAGVLTLLVPFIHFNYWFQSDTRPIDDFGALSKVVLLLAGWVMFRCLHRPLWSVKMLSALAALACGLSLTKHHLVGNGEPYAPSSFIWAAIWYLIPAAFLYLRYLYGKYRS